MLAISKNFNIFTSHYAILPLLVLLFVFKVTSGQISEEYGTGENGFLNFYQKHVSGARGTICSMHPSCSQYSKLAFENYNPFKAYFITCDRMLRCGHDLVTYEPHSTSKGFLAYDPINVEYTCHSTQKINFIPFAPDSTGTSFADQLFKDQDFELALLEYKRRLFMSTQPEQKSQLSFKISQCYYLTEQYPKLEKLYSDYLSKEYVQQDERDSMTLLLAKSYFLTDNFSKSISLLEVSNTDGNQSSEARFLMGLNHLMLENWKESETFMSTILESSARYTTANRFHNLCQEAEQINQRKPGWAAVSSIIIPGSGYLYSNKPQTALVSLVINTLFIWTAVEAYNNENYALSSGAAVLGMGWYFGSIRGSFISTKKWNLRQKENFINSKTRYIKIN